MTFSSFSLLSPRSWRQRPRTFVWFGVLLLFVVVVDRAELFGGGEIESFHWPMKAKVKAKEMTF